MMILIIFFSERCLTKTIIERDSIKEQQPNRSVRKELEGQKGFLNQPAEDKDSLLFRNSAQNRSSDGYGKLIFSGINFSKKLSPRR